ncbi:MAG: NAD(P)/FAD-dependent oxidoreductase [Clostridium sp.]
MYDILIIGAGVIGASIARELSKYELNICVLEKSYDVANGTSKANSGIIHAGFDASPNSLKGKLNALGNSMFDSLQKELHFPFRRNGSLVLGFSKEDKEKLQELIIKGEKNGVPNLKLLHKDEILKLEPNINQDVKYALYAPSGGIICPYEFTIALCENAFENGVEFKLNHEVTNIIKNNEHFYVYCNEKEFKCKYLINAAGVHSDDINNLLSKNKLKVTGRRGEYCLFDKIAGSLVTSTIFQLPTKLGKGVLVTQTVDGNLLVGPTALDDEDKENIKTTFDGIHGLLEKGKETLKSLPTNRIITSFSGMRAHLTTDDFIIEECDDVKNFFNAAGIESPGLSSAPAIAVLIRDLLSKKTPLKEKKNFNPYRKEIPRVRVMSNQKRKELIASNPLYGHIVCRCEMVSEGEIRESIKRSLGATTVDGVKLRTRASMGGCQGGFCTPLIVKILSEELGIPITEVKKSCEKSTLLVGEIKEGF